MNAIRHSFSYTVGGDHEWSGVACVRNADGSFTDGFCSRLGFVLVYGGSGSHSGEPLDACPLQPQALEAASAEGWRCPIAVATGHRDECTDGPAGLSWVPLGIRVLSFLRGQREQWLRACGICYISSWSVIC